MNRSNDAWPVTVLFAVLVLFLAKAMAGEKTVPVAGSSYEQKPARASSAAIQPCSELGEVPDFKIKDPLSKEFCSESLYKTSGMLVMITVPNLTQYERQKKWERFMSHHRWPERGAPQRVLIEDMSQQKQYKEKARGMMKASYKPDGDVIVLIDETGDVRREFGMMDNETMIVLCDAKGRILHLEPDEIEPDDAAARRLMSEVTRLADANVKSLPPKVAATNAPATTMLLMTAAPVRK
jgi:hypothetical protein